MKSLLLCVTYTSKPGEGACFVKEIEKSGILEIIRKEEGCLRYDYFCPAFEDDKILLVEKWRTEEDQKRHLQQPHMDTLKKIKEQYITDTQVEKAFTEGESYAG